MARRFCDTDAWKDKWYISLKLEYREIWRYMLSTCTHAGRVLKDMKKLNTLCGTSVSEDDLREIFKDRIIDRGTYFFIPYFLRLQYPAGLNSRRTDMLDVREEIFENGLHEIVRGMFGADYLAAPDGTKTRFTTSGQTIPLRKHSFEESPYIDYDRFRAALPQWPDEKVRYWYERAIGYSRANGGKYLNWILAVQNWERMNEERKKRRSDPSAVTGSAEKYKDAGFPVE